jgi:hypothetical protein
MRKTIAIAALLFWHAQALEITGTVQDKFSNPLPGVKLCLQGSASQCVTSDAQGKFHWSAGGSALRPTDPGLIRMELGFRDGKMFLRAPASGAARLEWFDLAGGRLAPAQTLMLASGDNAAPLPQAATRKGMAFLKLTGSAFTVTWKVLLAGADGGAVSASPPSMLAMSAKVSAASASLDVSLDKYKPFVYVPSQETETNAIIELRPLGDRILWDGHGLDAWDDHSNGSWKMVGNVLHQDGGGGVIATKDNFGTFRMSFVSRGLAGSDHKPTTLMWCKPGSTDNRTMGGIQFQPPMGSMWDYTKNNDPNKRTQTRLVPQDSLVALGWDALKWSRCEALASQTAATIRFACCMLDSTGEGPCHNAVEHVLFKDPTYARSGPFALMIHDGKQKQEYKHIEIEPDPINADKMLLTHK